MKTRPLLIALVAAFMPSVFAFCYFIAFPDPPLSRVFYAVSRVFFIGLPVLWTVCVDRQRFPFPRFKGDGLRAGTVSGMLIGLAAIILYINVFQSILPVSEVKEKAGQLGFGGEVFIIFAFFIVIANSSLEEYYWRWFGFSKLRSVLRTRMAVLVSGAGFALHHVIILAVFFGWPCGLLFGVCVGTGGMLWCHLYDKYDSIWPAWISHAIVDAAVMMIGFDMLFCQGA